jgi:excisionase family DNA binding protein
MVVLKTVQIVSTPDVLGGRPRIEGRRIGVQQVAECYEHLGWSIDEIAAAFDLRLSEIYAALSYYHAHRDEIDSAIGEAETQSERLHAKYGSADDDNLKLVMTPKEIAEEYRVTVEAVYQAVRRGSIPHRKSGGTILIRRRDAQARWGKGSSG